MSPQWAQTAQVVAWLGLVLGVIGTVAPILPGPILVWASILLWAWADGFQAVGWPTLILLAALTGLAELSDLALSAMGARRGGASWRSMAVAGVAAIVGMLVFGVIGALIGAFLGLLLWETRLHGGEWRKAWRASGSFIIGYLIAIVVKIVFVAAMLAVFVWQVFSA